MTPRVLIMGLKHSVLEVLHQNFGAPHVFIVEAGNEAFTVRALRDHPRISLAAKFFESYEKIRKFLINCIVDSALHLPIHLKDREIDAGVMASLAVKLISKFLPLRTSYDDCNDNCND